MTDDRFVSLVMDLELEARQSPGFYKFRVVSFALLAYLYIFFFLFLALGLLAVVGLILFYVVTNLSGPTIAALKILIPLALGILIFVAAILRALWLRIPEPDGIILERGEAVRLYQEIDRLRAELHVPHFHQILLDNDFNAGVVQVPLLGLFGFHRNYLVIGIPLLATLSKEHFRAVLAHELGHISEAHSRFDQWIIRVFHTWGSLLERLEIEDNIGVKIFRPFFRWYLPRFAALTFAIDRANEYEADRHAAALVGAPTMAAMLIALYFQDRRLRSGWREPLDSPTAQRWLNDALSEKTHVTDSHPSLSDRLRGLGQHAVPPEPFEQSALDWYMGSQAEILAQHVGVNLAALKVLPPTSTARNP